jgi:hypothetical protein
MMGAGRRWWLGLAAVAAGGCRSAPPPIHLEAAYVPVGKVCDRVHDVMRSTDEGWIAVELPAVAEMVVIVDEDSGRTGDCGGELLAWLRAAVAARPIDLRPRLEARVRALGSFVAAGGHWSGSAAESLYALLIDQGKPIGHVYEARQFLGPGSLSVPGWRAAVSLDDLDSWVAASLRRGYAQKVPMPTRSGNEQGDKYADTLVRLFAARYGTPGTGEAGHLVSPFFQPAHARPPEPAELGCGRSALDRLWPDLVRVFRASPLDERWTPLPAAIINRLRHPEPTSPCG